MELGQALVLTLMGATITAIALVVGIIANIEGRTPARVTLCVYVGLLLASLFVFGLGIEKTVIVGKLVLGWCFFQALAIAMTLVIILVKPFERLGETRFLKRFGELRTQLREYTGELSRYIDQAGTPKEARVLRIVRVLTQALILPLRIAATFQALRNALYILIYLLYGAFGCGLLLWYMATQGFR